LDSTTESSDKELSANVVFMASLLNVQHMHAVQACPFVVDTIQAVTTACALLLQRNSGRPIDYGDGCEQFV